MKRYISSLSLLLVALLIVSCGASKPAETSLRPMLSIPAPSPVSLSQTALALNPAPIPTLTSTPANLQWFPTREKGDWTLIYEVSFSKGSRKAEVTIHLNDPLGEVTEVYLRKQPSGPFVEAPDRITNLHATNSQVTEDFWIVEGAKEAKLSYTVDINIEYDGGGYASFASSNWIVTGADALFIVGGYRGWGTAPRELRLTINAPEGWVIHTPYPELNPGEFDPEGMIHNPFGIRDFMVIGDPESLDIAQRPGTDIDFKVVAVETERVDPEEVLDYFVNLDPVYWELASGRPPSIFVVTAPEPMRRWGGDARCVSIFVSDDNPFPFDLSWGSSTWAHEFHHLYQRYYAEDVWLKEGVTYYYQIYGPFRAGYMTVDEFLDVLIEVIADRADKNAILAKDQCVYFKGALVTLALDIKIRQDSGGKYSFNDVFKVMNTEFPQEYVSSAALNNIIMHFTGKSYESFFQRYVEGSEYPHEVLASAKPELYEVILAYYRAYSGDPNVVETEDLLKAADDWASGAIPEGFTEFITTKQLLQLADEWIAAG